MLKTLGAQVKEFKADSIRTPLFMILEVVMEMVIPLMMASIVDDGVQAGDMAHIYKMGVFMALAAAVGLFAGVMGGKYGARASAGFAKNLRQAMYENIQTFSFSNIDKFSTAGLVTRMTTDVTKADHRCHQPAERLPDDFTDVYARACKLNLRAVHGVLDQCQNCDRLSGCRPVFRGRPDAYHPSGNEIF